MQGNPRCGSALDSDQQRSARTTPTSRAPCGAYGVMRPGGGAHQAAPQCRPAR
jgi:hypothetical protein